MDDGFKPSGPLDNTDEALAPGWVLSLARDLRNLIELVRDGLKPSVDEIREEQKDQRADVAGVHQQMTMIGAQIETLSSNLSDTKANLEARVHDLEIAMATLRARGRKSLPATKRPPRPQSNGNRSRRK